MKKIYTILALLTLGTLSAQVGIGTTTPQASSVLDLTSTNKALLLPRVANTAAISSPENGMIIYDISSNCIKSYENNAWSKCFSAENAPTTTVVADCNVDGFTGSFIRNVGLAGAKFSITITNNSFATAGISFAPADLVLSGVSGVTVSSVSPTTVSLIAGQSQRIDYTLSGTPSATGTITGTWTKLSLNCTKTVNVSNGDAAFTFPQNKYAVSIYDAGPPLIDYQGYIDNATNKLEASVPFTGGSGSYDAYTSPWTAIVGQGGDSNNIRYSYIAGTFTATGSIPITFEIDGDGTFSVTKQAPGSVSLIKAFDFVLNGNNKGVINVNAVGGVLNTNFMSLVNGAKYGITGANTATASASIPEYGPTQYNATFGTDAASWRSGGAFYYDDGTTKLRPTKNVAVATTWNNSGANINGEAYMVVDFGQERVFNTIFAHQTNSDGRFTSVEVSIANTPLPGNDPGWTVVKSFVADEVGCLFDSEGYELSFPISISRYVRYRFKNETTCGSNNYIEAFGIGTFLHFD